MLLLICLCSLNVLWSPSYFAASCGGAPLDILKRYIQNQAAPQPPFISGLKAQSFLAGNGLIRPGAGDAAGTCEILRLMRIDGNVVSESFSG